MSPSESAIPHLDIDLAFREHGVFIARVARGLTGPGDHVDDLTQEVFITAFKKRADFEGRSSLRAWLYGITRNHCMRHQRGSRRYRLFKEKLERLDIQEPDESSEQMLARKGSILRIHNALQALPDKLREVAVLYELESMEGRAIAELTELPLGTVWTRIRQARKQLEKTMHREVLEGNLA